MLKASGTGKETRDSNESKEDGKNNPLFYRRQLIIATLGTRQRSTKLGGTKLVYFRQTCLLFFQQQASILHPWLTAYKSLRTTLKICP